MFIVREDQILILSMLFENKLLLILAYLNKYMVIQLGFLRYSTQSYTGYEPTSMRAIRARYNPYLQAIGRINQLQRLGHSIDKVQGVVNLRNE